MILEYCNTTKQCMLLSKQKLVMCQYGKLEFSVAKQEAMSLQNFPSS